MKIILEERAGAHFTADMRIGLGLVCAALLVTGCFHHKPSVAKSTPPKPYITPELRTTVGRVELVNKQARFVVISFPSGKVPPVGQNWRINHRGVKIGQVTITGPQRDTDTVADLVEGEANVGDQAAPE